MNEGGPHVSIVVPAFNVAPFVRESLQSVLGQAGPEREIIVVDDGSEDGTADAAASVDPGVQVIRTGNGGVSAARNRGLAAARAPYLIFLDGDDLLAPNALMRMTAALGAAPAAPAAFGRHQKFSDRSADGARIYQPAEDLPVTSGETLARLLQRNIVRNVGAMICRTAAARAAGGFDPALRLGEDWEFYCRLALLGDFALVPGPPLLFYRQRLSGANFQLRGTALRQRNEAADRVYANPAIRARFAARTLWRWRRRVQAEHFWSAARMELWSGRRFRFLTYVAVGLFRHPMSFLRWDRVRPFLRSLSWRPRSGNPAA